MMGRFLLVELKSSHRIWQNVIELIDHLYLNNQPNMRSPFLIITFSVLCNSALSLNPESEALAYQHLLEVNSYWENFAEFAPNLVVSFPCEKDRIQFHLQMVVSILAKNSCTERKKELLDKLWEYADEQEFPKNSYHLERRPYFIDNEESYCAVGFLMKESGYDAMARSIQSKYNYDYLKDIQIEGMEQWSTLVGFTKEELAWIQPGYPANTIFNPVMPYVNGPVTHMAPSGDNEELIIHGDFDALGTEHCDSIIRLSQDGAETLVFPFSASVQSVQTVGTDSDRAMSGSFHDGENQYQAVIYEGEAGFTLIQNPSRPYAIGKHMCYAGTSYYIVSQTGLDPLHHEVWRYFPDSGIWEKKAEFSGHCAGINNERSPIYVYGHIDSAKVFSSGGIDTTIFCNNIFSIAGPDSRGIIGETSDTVLCMTRLGTAEYFGGTDSTGPVLFRYVNNQIQHLYSPNPGFQVRSIRTIKSYDTQHLILGGEFHFTGMGTLGSGLALYNPASHSLHSYGNFNGPVNTVASIENRWFVGGEFSYPYPNLVEIAGSLAVDDHISTGLNLHPNPANAKVILELNRAGKDFSYQILDFNGRVIDSGDINSDRTQLELNNVASGKYVIQVYSENEIRTKLLIKE